MKVEAHNTETGEKISVDISNQQYNDISGLARDRVSDSKLDYYVDNLDISADAKAIISSILKTTIRIGQQIIRIGKRIIEIVLAVVSQFPNTTFGLVLGLLVGALVGSIPILGVVLGSIVMPLAVAFGLAKGYMEDLRDKSLEGKIAQATAMFEPLKGQG